MDEWRDGEEEQSPLITLEQGANRDPICELRMVVMDGNGR